MYPFFHLKCFSNAIIAVDQHLVGCLGLSLSCNWMHLDILPILQFQEQKHGENERFFTGDPEKV